MNAFGDPADSEAPALLVRLFGRLVGDKLVEFSAGSTSRRIARCPGTGSQHTPALTEYPDAAQGFSCPSEIRAAA
jgi:hypothetical protein